MLTGTNFLKLYHPTDSLEKIIDYLRERSGYKFQIGQDINDKVEGVSLLHLAARYSNPLIVETLLKNGANTNTTDTFGRTPLHIATSRDDIETIKLLLKKGARINVQDHEGRTPLCTAIDYGNIEVIELLETMQNISNLFGMSIFFSDGFVKLKEKQKNDAQKKIKKFFEIQGQLPMELKIKMANIAYGSAEQFIPKQNIDEGLLGLVEHYQGLQESGE